MKIEKRSLFIKLGSSDNWPKSARVGWGEPGIFYFYVDFLSPLQRHSAIEPHSITWHILAMIQIIMIELTSVSIKHLWPARHCNSCTVRTVWTEILFNPLREAPLREAKVPSTAMPTSLLTATVFLKPSSIQVTCSGSMLLNLSDQERTGNYSLSQSHFYQVKPNWIFEQWSCSRIYRITTPRRQKIAN